jgi:hypothetical protein
MRAGMVQGRRSQFRVIESERQKLHLAPLGITYGRAHRVAATNASMPPRRARPRTRHRSSGNGTLPSQADVWMRADLFCSLAKTFDDSCKHRDTKFVGADPGVGPEARKSDAAFSKTEAPRVCEILYIISVFVIGRSRPDFAPAPAHARAPGKARAIPEAQRLAHDEETNAQAVASCGIKPGEGLEDSRNMLARNASTRVVDVDPDSRTRVPATNKDATSRLGVLDCIADRARPGSRSHRRRRPYARRLRPVGFSFAVQANHLRRPLRVWNGIFAAGDWRAKRDLKTISPNRDRNSETTAREKWPQKQPLCLQVLISRFRKTGWWADQGSNLGPTD